MRFAAQSIARAIPRGQYRAGQNFGIMGTSGHDAVNDNSRSGFTFWNFSSRSFLMNGAWTQYAAYDGLTYFA